MAIRILAAVLGVFHTLNGMAMLSDAQRWFDSVAAGTGPFNEHFVLDVGFAFFAGGLAFLAYAWRPRLKLVAFGASGFLVFHALLHCALAIAGETQNPITDIVAVVIPAVTGAAISWPTLEDAHVVQITS